MARPATIESAIAVLHFRPGFAQARPAIRAADQRASRALPPWSQRPLGERIAVTEYGHRKRITKLEAAVKQLVNRAASGEARAMQLLLALVQASEARPPQADANRLAEGDEIVLRELQRRLTQDAS